MKLAAGPHLIVCSTHSILSELELVQLVQYCNRMKLQMLTDGKPTNLIKTHALLSQNRKIEKALPKENVFVFNFSCPAIQKTLGVRDME
jgi:hypothetical protein